MLCDVAVVLALSPSAALEIVLLFGRNCLANVHSKLIKFFLFALYFGGDENQKKQRERE